MMRWRGIRLAVLLAGVLLLAGCASVATESASPVAPAGVPYLTVEARPVQQAAPGRPPSRLDNRMQACLPDERLHPVSRMYLDAWLDGIIPTRTFRRFFHMPNSDYLPVGECLVNARRAVVRTRSAGSRL